MMKSKWQWLLPKYWGVLLFVGFGRLFVCLPFSWQLKFGRLLGRLSYPFLKRRKHITMTNLRVAFPEKSQQELQALCKKCFESIAISGIEMMIAWFMPKRRFAKIKMDTHGMENFENAHNDPNTAALMLGCHFTCMEVIGRYIGEHYKPFYLVYQKHKSVAFEHVMTGARQAYVTQCLQRKNVVSIVKALKRKSSVWYAPDQDFGRERSIFVPFFGTNCATLVATSWLADKTGAKVIPCYYVRKDDLSGYDIFVLPALENFPSGDDYQDARRYHEFLEAAIKQHPDQYLWQHRRYKTRPSGEGTIY
ncbi:lysophospholipid acyltransferase family protein [Facilibium subflavum]|uniref:lysophospholipid acyltransferase family protein n=1 Tax=Facilibium subflavum TaxID=2219058 RepID=UPI001F47356C|nr:lysophospholipid acyltransferase family protein [Facilibium subflavum]